jgi:beta-phosphoglucomutase-like phosphatase (HAD superfamily)
MNDRFRLKDTMRQFHAVIFDMDGLLRLALEDSENGVRSAVSAGMTVVQIPDLVQPDPGLRALGHVVLGTLRDVSTHAFAGPDRLLR